MILIILLLFCTITTKTLFATDSYSYNVYDYSEKYDYEPSLYNFSLADNYLFGQIPENKQILILYAIQNFEQEKENYSLELAPAVNEILQQKLMLELTFIELSSYEVNTLQDQTRLEAIKLVIDEKNQMLSNIILVEEDINKKLYSELKLKISAILNTWLFSNLKTENKVQQLLKELNIKID